MDLEDLTRTFGREYMRRLVKTVQKSMKIKKSVKGQIIIYGTKGE